MLLKRLLRDLWFGHSAADHASFRNTLSYWHKQIYQAETLAQFNVLRGHIENDAIRFRQVIDPSIVNTKVEFLFDLINERTDRYKPVFDYEYLYQ